jgi:hypothetical protein
MAKKEFRPLFGAPSSFWNKLDAVSTILYTTTIGKRAMNLVGENGLGGVGKNKVLAKYGTKGTSGEVWKHIDTISMVMFAFTLIHGAIDTYEEMNNISDDKQLMPGRGVIYSAYETVSELGGVF